MGVHGRYSIYEFIGKQIKHRLRRGKKCISILGIAKRKSKRIEKQEGTH